MPAMRVRPPDFYVDHRLTDHRAATHTAKETGGHIGHALRDTFLRSSAAFAGDFAHKVQRQQGFNQANRGQNDGIGQNNFEGFPVQRHHRNVEWRQSTLNRGQVANARNVQPKADHQRGNHKNTRQRAREWSE